MNYFEMNSNSSYFCRDKTCFVRLCFVFIILTHFISILQASELPDTSTPVVFVHGILSKRPVFWKMILRFEKDGFSCYNYSYPSVKKPIEEHGKDFVDYIEATFGDRDFYLVSHSMGNLVC
ncbi:MAG: hypothetical protein KAI81_01845, partial [Candidatus Marinimicrobia bacterium]|nr:hypothetical protein [Candidatus Neomarinimicrobiota bacterium]